MEIIRILHFVPLTVGPLSYLVHVDGTKLYQIIILTEMISQKTNFSVLYLFYCDLSHTSRRISPNQSKQTIIIFLYTLMSLHL